LPSTPVLQPEALGNNRLPPTSRGRCRRSARPSYCASIRRRRWTLRRGFPGQWRRGGRIPVPASPALLPSSACLIFAPEADLKVRTTSCTSIAGLKSALRSVPFTARRFDQPICFRGTPCARFIERRCGLRVLGPSFEYRRHPAPGRFDLIATHEQGRIANHHVEKQALVRL